MVTEEEARRIAEAFVFRQLGRRLQARSAVLVDPVAVAARVVPEMLNHLSGAGARPAWGVTFAWPVHGPAGTDLIDGPLVDVDAETGEPRFGHSM